MLVSIIIPIYNIENYVEECINSIINQSYKNLEIILVDDGSSDKSPLICDELAKKDNRIRVIHKENGGLSSARNSGIEIAKGEYLSFIDGDDIINKDMIKFMVNIAKDENADIVQCEYLRFSDISEIVDDSYDNKVTIFNNLQAIKNLYRPEINVSSIVTWSKIYKRDLFRNIRFPIGKLHEDEFTTYKLFYKANKIAYTNRKLCYYRQTPNSIMNSRFNKKRLDVLGALEERFDFIKNSFMDKELNDLSLDYYMMHCMRTYYLYKNSYPEDKKTLKAIQNRVKIKLNLINNCSLIGKKRNIRIRLFAINPSITEKIKKTVDVFIKKG